MSVFRRKIGLRRSPQQQQSFKISPQETNIAQRSSRTSTTLCSRLETVCHYHLRSHNLHRSTSLIAIAVRPEDRPLDLFGPLFSTTKKSTTIYCYRNQPLLTPNNFFPPTHPASTTEIHFGTEAGNKQCSSQFVPVLLETQFCIH